MKIKTVDENMQMSIIASVAFEANRQYCEMIGGKAYNPAWTEVGQDVRDALIESVKVALTDKIVSAELSHLRWANVRVEAGWSVGPEFNPHRKQDPNLVPFKELSVQEQLKDILFLAIVNSLGAALGYRQFDDVPLDEDAIQEHEETVADLETSVTGKTDFVPAGEGDGESITGPNTDDGEGEELENGLPVSIIHEHTSNDGKFTPEDLLNKESMVKEPKASEDLAKALGDDEQPDEKLAVAPEAVEPARPDELAPEDQNPKGTLPEPAQPPAPPEEDPVDHAATKAKKAKKK